MTRSYIKSKYFNLEEVHSFNLHLASLPAPHCNGADPEHKVILSLMLTQREYRKLNEYVEGSDTYNEIVKNIEAWEEAQKTLQSANYVSTEVVYEPNTSTPCITQHCYDIPSSKWDWEEEDYVDFTDTCIFYTSGYGNHIHVIENLNAYKHEYIIDDHRHTPQDLIQDTINHNKHLNKMIMMYNYCDEIEASYKDLEKIFNVDLVTFYYDSVIEYGGVKYYKFQVEALIAEYLVAKDAKYIKDDKYHDYPRYDFRYFIDFKNENTEYVLIENTTGN